MKRCFAFCMLLLGMAVPAPGQSCIQFFDDNPAVTPVVSPAPQAASLGQQPFPAEKEPDLTPSQTNTNQLNQLFQFETTPNICAAGEGYVSGNFDFLKFTGTTQQFRYQIQGQYGITDQIALGGLVPGITSKLNHTYTGLGDITLYGQYKLDKFINPEIIDITVQADFVLPTGNTSESRDTGKFGFRPVVLAYKDFGQHGPGDLSVYALCGFTITTNSDFRLGIAATYQINGWDGIFEFYDQNGVHGHPDVQLTPGISYRGMNPWEFTIGVPIGATKGTPDWGIIARITYVFAN